MTNFDSQCRRRVRCDGCEEEDSSKEGCEEAGDFAAAEGERGVNLPPTTFPFDHTVDSS